MQHCQTEIDGLIYRLRRSSPELGWREITEQINRHYKLSYSMNDLIQRYEMMTAKLNQGQVGQLFAQFQRWESNFEAIGDKTGISVSQVKREIIGGLVNNIWKVCFIVRKRKISSLKSNFLDNEQMKHLVVLMLRHTALQNVKTEYASLWGFISKAHSDDYYHTVSDEMYKAVYRELIILVEKLRINPQTPEHPHAQPSFETTILQHAHSQHDNLQQILELTKNRRKPNKQTINLVSDEEDSEHEQSGPSMGEYDLVHRWQNNLLRESIRLHSEMQALERALQNDPHNPQLQRERLLKAVAIGSLQIMTKKSDCL